jgi:hypothetical protein
VRTAPRHAGEPFADIVNHSITCRPSAGRSRPCLTSLALLALLLFGGSAINDFILALLIGIVSGTLFPRSSWPAHCCRGLAPLEDRRHAAHRHDPRAPNQRSVS